MHITNYPPRSAIALSLQSQHYVRQRDFYRAILDYQPQIVHFSGHGAGLDGIVLGNEADEPAFVNADALASLWNLDLDDLLRRGCDWIHDYLKNNPNVKDEDRHVCDNIDRKTNI